MEAKISHVARSDVLYLIFAAEVLGRISWTSVRGIIQVLVKPPLSPMSTAKSTSLAVVWMPG